MEDTFLCPECSSSAQTTDYDWDRPEQKPILMVCTECHTQYYLRFFREGKIKGLAFSAVEYEEIREQCENPESLLQELKNASAEG